MSEPRITEEFVTETANSLPGFPRVISEILATIDDPDANLHSLTELISLDPAIAAKVFAIAGTAARSRQLGEIRDVFTAASLIGLSAVRRLAIMSSCGIFFRDMAPAGINSMFWQHSVAVAVCAEEIAHHVSPPVSTAQALLAGLLHDVGQLRLIRFLPHDFKSAWTQALAHAQGIEEAEQQAFGVNHAVIGGWLASHWALPSVISSAIRNHHVCEDALEHRLVPVIHVAEVLSNALDLAAREENRVTHLSTPACRMLGLTWDGSSQSLFGKIAARSRHANIFFGAA